MGGRDRVAGLSGGAEDYQQKYYDALAEVVSALGRVDSLRPVLTVGRLDHYEDSRAFADAFFQRSGPPNIFQHEHYVRRRKCPNRVAPVKNGCCYADSSGFFCSGGDAERRDLEIVDRLRHSVKQQTDAHTSRKEHSEPNFFNGLQLLGGIEGSD